MQPAVKPCCVCKVQSRPHPCASNSLSASEDDGFKQDEMPESWNIQPTKASIHQTIDNTGLVKAALHVAIVRLPLARTRMSAPAPVLQLRLLQAARCCQAQSQDSPAAATAVADMQAHNSIYPQAMPSFHANKQHTASFAANGGFSACNTNTLLKSGSNHTELGCAGCNPI
jgi:hypothetical protein